MKNFILFLKKFLYILFGKQVLYVKDVQRNIDALGLKLTVTAIDCNEYRAGRHTLEVWIMETVHVEMLTQEQKNQLCNALMVDAIFWREDHPNAGFPWVAWVLPLFTIAKIIIEDQVLRNFLTLFIAILTFAGSGCTSETATPTPEKTVNILQHPEWEKMPRMWVYSPRTDTITEIVVHSTANRNWYATAIWHDTYLDTMRLKASFHYSVDSANIVMHADPVKYYAWHSSNKPANKRSIGIEMCQNSQTPQGTAAVIKNTVSLIKHLKMKYPSIREINFHDHYNKHKNCPSMLDAESREIFLSHLKTGTK